MTGRPARNTAPSSAPSAVKPQLIRPLRFRLDRDRRARDRALFDLDIDSHLRDCEIVKLEIGALVGSGRVRRRAIVIQCKTDQPVQFDRR